MSSRLEDFQVQGAMCLGAALAQYGEVGKYSKHRCGRVETVSATTAAAGITCGAWSRDPFAAREGYYLGVPRCRSQYFTGCNF